MKSAVLLLNFGEPEDPEPGSVRTFLERIFLANARLENGAAGEAARRRARELAALRLPALSAEYRAIGGSPLNAQTAAQAEALEAALQEAGRDVRVVVGMQFTDPDIPSAVAAARAAGVARVVALPLYPLCGPSTNLAALDAVRRAAGNRKEGGRSGGGGSGEGGSERAFRLALVGGWHVHAGYTALRASGIRAFAGSSGIDLGDHRTAVVFSAHGTPLRYLREGSAYDVYVRDHCERVARELGLAGYTIGYQNHANRPGVEWTRPAVEEAVAGLEADRVVVVPVSFMQEQSETLYELDIELRAAAEARGLAFHRVPVPHDDPRFIDVLAELVEPFLDAVDAAPPEWGSCRCRPDVPACCLTHELARRSA